MSTRIPSAATYVGCSGFVANSIVVSVTDCNFCLSIPSVCEKHQRAPELIYELQEACPVRVVTLGRKQAVIKDANICTSSCEYRSSTPHKRLASCVRDQQYQHRIKALQRYIQITMARSTFSTIFCNMHTWICPSRKPTAPSLQLKVVVGAPGVMADNSSRLMRIRHIRLCSHI